VNLSFDSPLVISTAAMSAALTLLKMTCVLLAAVGVSALMRRRSAGARHLVWLVALIAALILPLWSAWSPLPVRVLPAERPLIVATNVAEKGPAAAAITPVEPTPPAARDQVAAAPAARPIGIGTVLLAVWALGALVLLVRLALGAWVVRGILRRARILEQPDWQQPLYEIADRLGLADAPRLMQSDRIKMPFATGFLNAVIVLPAESAEWSSERRCAVLIHELAHVKRRDLIGHMVGGVACALYWFHPLVWKAAQHLRAESERACDDLALMLGTPASDYAEHLLDIVTHVRDEQHLPAVALAMAKPQEFEGRMLAILDPRRYRRAPGRVQTAWLVGSLTVLALVVGAVSPARRVTASPPAPGTDGTNAPLVSDDASDPSELEKLAAVTGEEKKQTKSQPDESARARDDGDSEAEAKAEAELEAEADADAESDEDAATRASRPQRIEVLARSLRTDPDHEVRRIAAWGLSQYARNEVAAGALVEAVKREENKDVREMATWGLSESRNPAALSALEAAYLRDKSLEVRRTAAWATGSIGSKSSVASLTTLLTDGDPEIRELAAWSIGSCSPALAPAALVRALNDTDRDVRHAAAWALYEIADPNTSDEIEAAFRKEKDREVQRGLIRALGAMGERSIPTLTRLVDSSDPELRAVAVAALAGGNATGPWPWPRPEPRPYP
jgi:beta-lactamase regulating signal transducer with metallopeptidase domain/HEAT repeat protein